MGDQFVPSYLYQKRGIWYFSKRVPVDVRDHHNAARIVKSLHTRKLSQAIRLSTMYLEKLEAYWVGMRMQKMDFLFKSPTTIATSVQSDTPYLTDAQAVYLELKGIGKPKTFHRAAERNVEYVVEALGNRPIGDYTTAEAGTFRNKLFERGLSSASVTRIFSTLRAIVNITIQEHGLDIRNAFAGIYIPQNDQQEDRKPIPVKDIKAVQSACYDSDDSLRHLVALISDTGMRLSEAVGLIRDDLKLDGEIPYVDLKPHPWRPLKTSDSTRKIPLVGASLWAAKRLSKQEHHLFPQYNKKDQSNGNSASAAANKWLRTRVPEGCVMHSFRHSMRDRLRAVECPSEIINQIGGWHTAGVGQGYGDGYPIIILSNWMTAISIE